MAAILATFAADAHAVLFGANLNAPAKVKLTSAGRSLLRRHASTKVYVNATISGKKITGVRVTLKR